MKLKKYHKEDSEIICSWIKDEWSLCQWSADIIGKFPLPDNALTDYYTLMEKNNKIIPFNAFDSKDNLVGHMFIRYPDKDDTSTVRFGFVIVDPALRGHGNGKKMLQSAIDYAKNTLFASRITLGVFTNNDPARHCYESLGFRAVGKSEIFKMSIGEWECIEMARSII